MKVTKNVDEYISTCEPGVQEILHQLRKTVKNAAPEATEGISYMMPVYKQNGVLVYFGAFKSHIGFFPGPSGIETFKDRLTEYKTSKGTIQFPLNKEIPFDLVHDIVSFKVEENRLKAILKKK